jgi:hypothetical protein
MKTLVFAIIACLIALPAAAARTLSIEATPTNLDGQDGHTLSMVRDARPAEEFFLFESNGLVTFHSARTEGGDWSPLGGDAALVPVTTGDVVPAMTFDFLPSGCSLAQEVTYIGMQAITVPAGTFMTYRFDIADVCDPGRTTRFHWADGVGLVREAQYLMGEFVEGDDLTSHTIVGGSGLFPRAAGNLWVYGPASVPNDSKSIGTLKAKFTD